MEKLEELEEKMMFVIRQQHLHLCQGFACVCTQHILTRKLHDCQQPGVETIHVPTVYTTATPAGRHCSTPWLRGINIIDAVCYTVCFANRHVIVCYVPLIAYE